jgi:hypothetical protein
VQVRDDYEEPAYGMIDTLFSLAEAYLFMQLVELVVSGAAENPSKRQSNRITVTFSRHDNAAGAAFMHAVNVVRQRYKFQHNLIMQLVELVVSGVMYSNCDAMRLMQVNRMMSCLTFVKLNHR